MPQDTNSALPLEGLVVVELASVLAGPMAGMFFAELGATVHKIENARTHGDVTRGWRLANGDDGPISAYYASVNYRKEVHMLDLNETDDHDKAVTLLASADIVISNYSNKTAAKLGVDYTSVAALAPSIIYAQLYAYDEHDPRPGYDLVMQAESGFMLMNGHPDGLPAKMPVALIDIMAAHQIKEGILLSLYQRRKDSKGAHIKVSLYQSAIASLANQASNYLMADHLPQRLGTLHPNIAPYGDVFETNDQQLIILAVGSDQQWQKLVKTLNFTATEVDTFGDNQKRVVGRDQLSVLLAGAISKLSYDNLSSQLLSNAIPHCKIMSLAEVFEQDLAQQMVLDTYDPAQTQKRVSTIAFTTER